MAKGIVKKIIGGLVSVGIVAGTVLAVTKLTGNEPNPADDTPDKLATVENIEYNIEDKMLTWGEVENADTYNVRVNGETTQVKDSYFTVDVDALEYTFQIQALDSTGEYSPSSWSSPYVVAVPVEEFSVAAVNGYIADQIEEAIYGCEVQKIASVHAEGKELVTKAVLSLDGSDEIMEFRTVYANEITSLADVVSGENPIERNIDLYGSNDIVDYDSASYFLRAAEYGDQMQALRDQGYEFSVVESQAYDLGDYAAGLSGILKATNGIDTKYLSVDIGFGVSTNLEGFKYTSAIQNIDPDMIVEQTFVELTGDFAEYAKMLDEQNVNTQQSDLGMSY